MTAFLPAPRLAGAQTWAGLGIFAYNLHWMTVTARWTTTAP
ncbi:hypothetical protein [Streptomyces sp. NPDC006285]